MRLSSRRTEKQRNWVLLQRFLRAVSLCSLWVMWRATLIYLPMLCQKVSSISHGLTFPDPSQVSQGPNKESAPQAQTHQAPKVKTRRSVKSPFSTVRVPREISLHFLYVLNVWLQRWFPDHRMPKGTECEITPSRECLSRGSVPSSLPSSSIIAF